MPYLDPVSFFGPGPRGDEADVTWLLAELARELTGLEFAIGTGTMGRFRPLLSA